jgi:uncharacterized protein involved in exopolysaccharide biosynthesis
LELNRSRDQLSMLQKDVDNAQRALEAVNLRYTQTSLEGNVNQTDIAILNPAVPPIEPSKPKVMLNILLSIVFGGMLGVGFGLLAEMMDRRVRGREDIVEMLDVPVFAVVERKMVGRSRLSLPRLPRRLLPSA